MFTGKVRQKGDGQWGLQQQGWFVDLEYVWLLVERMQREVDIVYIHLVANLGPDLIEAIRTELTVEVKEGVVLGWDGGGIFGTSYRHPKVNIKGHVQDCRR